MPSTSRQLFRNTLDRLPAVPELRSSEALGRSATNAHVSLEFQIGTSLVWFQFDASSDERDAIAAGNKLLLTAHASASKAMQLAENESRASVPAFWADFDCTTETEKPLSIWGVRLRIAEGEIDYHISENHELFGIRSTTFSVLDVYEEHPIPFPDFPDRHHVYVTRTSTDSWSVDVSRA